MKKIILALLCCLVVTTSFAQMHPGFATKPTKAVICSTPAATGFTDSVKVLVCDSGMTKYLDLDSLHKWGDRNGWSHKQTLFEVLGEGNNAGGRNMLLLGTIAGTSSSFENVYATGLAGGDSDKAVIVHPSGKLDTLTMTLQRVTANGNFTKDSINHTDESGKRSVSIYSVNQGFANFGFVKISNTLNPLQYSLQSADRWSMYNDSASNVIFPSHRSSTESLYFPQGGNSDTIPVSVNGVRADRFGNIILDSIITGRGVGSTVTYTVSDTLTPDQLQAGTSSPIDIPGIPVLSGVGYYWRVESFDIRFIYNSQVYLSTTIGIGSINDAGVVYQFGAGILQLTANRFTPTLRGTIPGQYFDNDELVISTDMDSPGTGDSGIRYYLKVSRVKE